MDKLDSWKPSASITNLLKRAAIVTQIRQFFKNNDFLEVETPTMSQATITDINLFPFKTKFIGPGAAQGIPLFLITSPEYHMKRLLAAGSGPIFQICRSFRNEEYGRLHNPEFTMLEWYRPFWDMYLIMNEVKDLLHQILNCDNSEIISYQEIFMYYVGVNPLSANKETLKEIVSKLELNNIVSIDDDTDTLLQLLFTILVEPNLNQNKPIFIYHFPAAQAFLAKINPEDPRVADRFEVYFRGVELANGFRELIDAQEQRQRFIQNNRKRTTMNLPQYPLDENFLTALEHGMPECSGVALGVDRLVMLALKAENLSDVIAFSVKCA